MYDFTHGQSDSIERITHSICTLEFENHRPLYDWYCQQLGIYNPQQIEFARLNLDLHRDEQTQVVVAGEGRAGQRLGRSADADDLRLAAPRLHARGDSQFLRSDWRGEVQQHDRHGGAGECASREDLNRRATRALAVLPPLKVVLENYPAEPGRADGGDEQPGRSGHGYAAACPSRGNSTSRRMISARTRRPKFFRLAPGREVRLRAAYIIKCVGVVKDASGRDYGTPLHLRSGIAQRHAGRQPQSQGHVALGFGRTCRCRPKSACSTICSDHGSGRCAPRPGLARESERRLAGDLGDCRLEPSLAQAQPGDHFQFERLGYFVADAVDSRPGHPVFNRSVPLRDTWAKIEKNRVDRRMIHDTHLCGD